MNVATVAPQIATMSAVGPASPEITIAHAVAKQIQFAQSLAAGPMPSVESIRQAAAGAHEVADAVWAGGARRGDIYGPLYTSASVNAKAGAEALDKIADVLAMNGSGVEAHDAIERQSIIAATTLRESEQNFEELRRLGV